MQNEIIKQSFSNSKGFDVKSFRVSETPDTKKMFRTTLKN